MAATFPRRAVLSVDHLPRYVAELASATRTARSPTRSEWPASSSGSAVAG